MTNVAMRGTQRLAVIAAPSLLLAGCVLRGAPSFEIFGAYFPIWLLGGVIGLLAALLAHRLFVATGWASIVPLQLSVCLAIGLMVAVLVWLSGTGHLL
ncbi:YtcA family lipoprotein [Paraburkholderia youngii]|uniref:YtcA family lipoprotein n=1 Tax=Paraburkholderia youngii TaxID=2782701 RepID=UPI003D2430C0